MSTTAVFSSHSAVVAVPYSLDDSTDAFSHGFPTVIESFPTMTSQIFTSTVVCPIAKPVIVSSLSPFVKLKKLSGKIFIFEVS